MAETKGDASGIVATASPKDASVLRPDAVPFQPASFHPAATGSTPIKSLQLPSFHQRKRQPFTTPSKSKLSAATLLALAASGAKAKQIRNDALSEQLEKVHVDLNKRFDETDKGVAKANQGIDSIQKELLGQTAEAERRAAEAEKQRAELEKELAVTKVTMQHNDEIAKKKEESQEALLAALNVQLDIKEAALDHQRQISATHHGQTNSRLRNIQYQLDEAKTKNSDNAADVLEQLETLQFDLAVFEDQLTARSDGEKERYELECARLEKRLDGWSASLHLLGQPGKMIQQADELKAASKEEHSIRLQAESQIAGLKQQVKLLRARNRSLAATTSSNGRKSKSLIMDEAKELSSSPTDHVDIGDAKAPATSSTRPILGNRDANTDADATTKANNVQSLVKGASGDINRRTTAREEREFASRTQGLLPPVQTMPRRTTRSTPCKPPRTPARKAASEGKTPLRRSARKRN